MAKAQQSQKNSFIGQPGWQEYFSRLIQENRLAHAYLFVGEAHLGKRTFVEALIRAALCAERSGLEACGVCKACLDWRGSLHRDVSWLDATEQGSIDDVRAFIGSLATKPSLGQVRVGVILGLDHLTMPSLHAMLKTLEEPPASTQLFLTAERALALPATIRSRVASCQFSRLSISDLADALKSRGLEDREANELAALSGGRPGQALLWKEDSGLLKQYQTEASGFVDVLARVGSQRFAATETLAKEETTPRRELDSLLAHWMEVLRDGLLISLNQHEHVTHQFLKPSLTALARSPASWQTALETLLTTREDLRHFANRRLALNSFFIRV